MDTHEPFTNDLLSIVSKRREGKRIVNGDSWQKIKRGKKQKIFFPAKELFQSSPLASAAAGHFVTTAIRG